MGVDVIGAILGVVFENENRRVLPVGAGRDFLDEQAESVVIVGDRTAASACAGGCHSV